MSYRSRVVRLTIPIPEELSERLSVLAYQCDLTRGQLVRRYLSESAARAARGFADLAGESVEEWWPTARAGWIVARNIGLVDHPNGAFGQDDSNVVGER